MLSRSDANNESVPDHDEWVRQANKRAEVIPRKDIHALLTMGEVLSLGDVGDWWQYLALPWTQPPARELRRFRAWAAKSARKVRCRNEVRYRGQQEAIEVCWRYLATRQCGDWRDAKRLCELVMYVMGDYDASPAGTMMVVALALRERMHRP